MIKLTSILTASTGLGNKKKKKTPFHLFAFNIFTPFSEYYCIYFSIDFLKISYSKKLKMHN